MVTRTQVATILQKALGQEEGLLVLEYVEERVPHDVARQRDIAEVRLEIEKVHAEIEKVRADLSRDIEKVHVEIEKVRADLSVRIERMQAVQTRWAFVFWLSQMVVLGGLLLAVLRLLGQV